MEDIEIIELLFDRQENALVQITIKYAPLYKNIIKKLLEAPSDIEECENDVLLSIWNSIPPARPTNLAAYICKLARNISINKYKYNSRKKRTAIHTAILCELDECIADNGSYSDFSALEKSKEIKEVLSKFLKELDAENRILFIRRYFYLESIASLSKRFKMPQNTVSVKLHRSRQKLSKLLRKEDITI